MNRQLKLLLYRVVCLGYAFMLGLTLTQAQQVARVEYYVDTDPGFGKGTNVPITPGLDVTQSFTVPINSFSGGFHNLYVRALVRPYQVVEDDKTVTKGGWSLTNVRTFYKEEVPTNIGTAVNVVKGEYFFNTDPGFGRGINIPVTPGQDLTNVSLTVPISALSSGFHNLYVRFKDANGRWSLTAVRTFYKEETVAGTGALPNIVKGEYFIDNDPGFGRGINIPVSPGTDLNNVSFAANLSDAAPGFHNLYVRFKDAKGRWGLTNMRAFYKEVQSVQDPLPNIVRVEYFIDTDPGFGKGKKVSFTPGTDLSSLTFAVDMTDVSIGNHQLYVRAQDANGKWSLTSKGDFKVEPPSELIVTVGSLSGPLCAGAKFNVPFTVNAPFGSNNVFKAQLSDGTGSFANPVEIGTLTGNTAGSISATLPAGTAAGTGYRVRIVASSPTNTSAPNSTNLVINRVPNHPGGITGNSQVCVDFQTYSLPAANGVTYAWTLADGTAVGTGNSVSVNWTAAGAFTLTATPSNSCGPGASTAISVQVYPAVPTQVPVITYSSSYLYASGTGAGVSGYQWYKNGAAISGATGSNLLLSGSGTYTLRFTNPCGVGPESQPMVIQGALPAQTITFNAIPNKTFGDAPITLEATSSSGLPVSFSVVGGNATVAGNVLTIGGAGTVTVRATQAGTENFAPAPSVDRSFPVAPAPATVVLSNLTQTYDGKAKTPLASTTPGGLSVSMTFNGTTTPPINAGSYAVVASINSANYTGSANGTFTIEQASQTITLESVPDKVFGNDPFSVLAVASSGLPVSLSITTVPSGIATLLGNTITILGAGTVTITASQGGNANYKAAASVSDEFQIQKAAQTISFAALSNKTYGEAPFTLSATTTAGLPVSFSVVEGPATISGSTVTITGPGTVTIRAAQAGNANYLAALPVDRSFSVSTPDKLNQTITFAALPNKTFGDAPVTLGASGSSGLPVSFSLVSGPATLSGNTLTLTGAGTVTVQALQSGNGTYNAAPPVQRSFTVNQAGQTITFAELPGRTFGDAPFTLSATATSGLAVSFSVLSGPATISGSTVTLTGPSTVTIRASQGGSDNYLAAPNVDRSFSVSTPDKQSQTIAFGELADRTFGEGPVTLSATATSGLPVSFSLVSGPATLAGSVLTLTGAGEVVVQALQAGNDTYNAAPPVQRSFSVQQAGQTIAFAQLSGKTCGEAPFEVTATASSGLPVAFSVVSGPATVSGNTLTLTGPGTVTIRASQAGNANFLAGTPVERAFAVQSAGQTITAPALAGRTLGEAPFAVSATASSGLPVSVSVESGPATVSGNTVTLTGAGTVCLRFSQAGGGCFAAAAPVDRCFAVREPDAEPQPQTISFAEPADRTFGDAPFALSATASSGLPVSLEVVSGPATISGNVVTLTGPGTVAVRASQAGNANYMAAARVERSFTVRGPATDGPQVTGFVLVNADTGEDIRTLQEGDVLDLALLPTVNLNVRAEVAPPQVGSVYLFLNGLRYIEHSVPYALFANQGAAYNAGVLPIGHNTLRAVPYGGRWGTGEKGEELKVNFTVIGHRVTRFVLVNADTDEDIGPLEEGAVLDLSLLPSRNLNVRADLNHPSLGSVVFWLNRTRIIEHNAIYALFGNNGNDYFAGTLPVGKHTLEAIPYTRNYGMGLAGEVLRVAFEVVEGAPMVAGASQAQGLLDLSRSQATRLVAYPNPMVGSSTVAFTVAEAGRVLVELYDMKGSLVRRLFDKEAESGRQYTVQLEREQLPEGFYLCRLVGSKSATSFRIRVEK